MQHFPPSYTDRPTEPDHPEFTLKQRQAWAEYRQRLAAWHKAEHDRAEGRRVALARLEAKRLAAARSAEHRAALKVAAQHAADARRRLGVAILSTATLAAITLAVIL